MKKQAPGHTNPASLRYERIKHILFFIELIAMIGFMLLLCVPYKGSSVSVLLSAFISAFSSQYYVHVIGYAAALSLFHTILFLPLSLFSGFIIEHRFGLSQQSLAQWSFDQLKSFMLNLIVGLILVVVLYFFLRNTPRTWWFFVALFWFGFSMLLNKLAPILILPLFYKLKPIENTTLKERLLALVDKVGQRVLGIYEFDMSRKTKKANAAFTGIGSSKRIILGDTLLENFSPKEIEVILAHELGHYKLKHIWKLIAIGGLSTFVGLFVASGLLKHWATQFPYQGVSDIAALPILMFVLFLFVIITLPLQNFYSRKLEKEADIFALELTQDVENFTLSMEKLARQNLANPEPNKIIEFLLYSHPSICRRINMARAWQKQQNNP